MSVKFTFSQTPVLNVEDLSIALVEGDTGDYGKFSSLADRNNNSERKDHPTIDLLQSTTENTLVCQGSLKLTQTYDDQYSNTDIDTALAEITATRIQEFNSTWYNDNCDRQVNYSNNTVVSTVTNIQDMVLSDWCKPGPVWALKVDDIRIETTEDNTKFLCVTYLNNSYNLYTTSYNNIAANESLTINKSKTTTYVMFTGPVVKDGLELNAYHAYKMKYETLTVENQSNNNILVYKWDK